MKKLETSTTFAISVAARAIRSSATSRKSMSQQAVALANEQVATFAKTDLVSSMNALVAAAYKDRKDDDEIKYSWGQFKDKFTRYCRETLKLTVKLTQKKGIYLDATITKISDPEPTDPEPTGTEPTGTDQGKLDHETIKDMVKQLRQGGADAEYLIRAVLDQSVSSDDQPGFLRDIAANIAYVTSCAETGTN